MPSPDEFLALLGEPGAPFWRDLGFYPRVSAEARRAFEVAFRAAIAPKETTAKPVFLGVVPASAVWALFRPAGYPSDHAPVYDPTGYPEAPTAWDLSGWPQDGEMRAEDPAVLALWPAAPRTESGEARVWRQPDGAILVRRGCYVGWSRWVLRPLRRQARHREYWEAGWECASPQTWNECEGTLPAEHPAAQLLLSLLAQA